MKLLIRSVLLLMLVAPGFCFAQNHTQGCKLYEPVSVVLAGKIVRKTFPGAPNYEDVHKGDRAEETWLLELESPICVTEDQSEPELNPAMKDIAIVQLVLREEDLKQYRSLLGKKVVAVGTLFGGHTEHHHAPLLLTVSSLQTKHWK